MIIALWPRNGQGGWKVWINLEKKVMVGTCSETTSWRAGKILIFFESLISCSSNLHFFDHHVMPGNVDYPGCHFLCIHPRLGSDSMTQCQNCGLGFSAGRQLSVGMQREARRSGGWAHCIIALASSRVSSVCEQINLLDVLKNSGKQTNWLRYA